MLPLAEIAIPQGRIALHAAPPITLHGDIAWRADGNSPALMRTDSAVVFVSAYEPRGHTFRRQGPLDSLGQARPVIIRNDPDPTVGKWIEAVWPAPDGRLFGWYHAEERAPCSTPLYVPHIGELVSEDDGATWHWRGEILRAPASETSCDYRNGFCAGGYGDLCLLPDRDQSFLYMPFSSFTATESAQGISLARLPLPRPENPAEGLELWSDGAWRQAADRLPQPVWPTRRGWRHSDPDAFWGPAVHYNLAIDSYVMLVNHTAGGSNNILQEGIYASINPRLDRPADWSRPARLVQGGAWYPQVVGLAPGDGDTRAGSHSRFYMAGFSTWGMEITTAAYNGPDRPLVLARDDFAPLFGAGLRSPW